VKTVAARTRKQGAFDPEAFLAKSGVGRKIVELEKKNTVFSQGDEADAVYYIQKGKIKLTVISRRGKEATIALLGAGDFLGEECIAAMQPQRLATAATASANSVSSNITVR
jgi:CRP/FNR family cyclic AMP-dependent transcriptional regulator